jgi:hypothetical protein
MQTEEDMRDQAIGASARVLLPIVMAIDKRSETLHDQLIAGYIEMAFRDGFAAGLHEGARRNAANVRDALGIVQEEWPEQTAGHFLKRRVQSGKHPYDKLSDANSIEEWR